MAKTGACLQHLHQVLAATLGLSNVRKVTLTDRGTGPNGGVRCNLCDKDASFIVWPQLSRPKKKKKEKKPKDAP
jgi:hypothetical protein